MASHFLPLYRNRELRSASAIEFQVAFQDGPWAQNLCRAALAGQAETSDRASGPNSIPEVLFIDPSYLDPVPHMNDLFGATATNSSSMAYA